MQTLLHFIQGTWAPMDLSTCGHCGTSPGACQGLAEGSLQETGQSIKGYFWIISYNCRCISFSTLIFLKERDSEGQKISHLLVHIPNVSNIWAGQSQELETKFRSPMWEAETQELESPPLLLEAETKGRVRNWTQSSNKGCPDLKHELNGCASQPKSTITSVKISI